MSSPSDGTATCLDVLLQSCKEWAHAPSLPRHSTHVVCPLHHQTAPPCSCFMAGHALTNTCMVETTDTNCDVCPCCPVRVMPPQEGSKERQVTTYETPVHVSSVQLIDPSDGKPTKIRMGTDVNGNPVRVSRRTGTPIPKPAYEDSDAGKKAAEAKRKYEDKFCDTAAADAARVTYRPSALSFEEEVIAGMRGLEIDWSRLADVDVEDPAPAPRA
eukprot:m.131293 g.131293  ORF g.131293 m.131293 type:complete len:215 (+) comp11309_c0_seq8:1701-2345(+)